MNDSSRKYRGIDVAVVSYRDVHLETVREFPGDEILHVPFRAALFDPGQDM